MVLLCVFIHTLLDSWHWVASCAAAAQQCWAAVAAAMLLPPHLIQPCYVWRVFWAF
jgi:hypothetical protein